MAHGWLAGMDITADRLFDHYARYERQSGSQTLSSGDQLAVFPTPVETDSQVTPAGSNDSWTLGGGLWLCVAGIRLSANVDFGIYWSKGAVASEVNSFGVGGGTAFVIGGATGMIAVPRGSTQVVNLTIWRGASAANIVPYGDGMTHVAFARLNLGG